MRALLKTFFPRSVISSTIAYTYKNFANSRKRYSENKCLFKADKKETGVISEDIVLVALFLNLDRFLA